MSTLYGEKPLTGPNVFSIYPVSVRYVEGQVGLGDGHIRLASVVYSHTQTCLGESGRQSTSGS